MSYVSEWQFAIRGSSKQVRAFETYLDKLSNDKKQSVQKLTAVTIFLRSRTCVAHNKRKGERALAFANSSTNCDGTWDEMIEDFLAKARKEYKVKASYARLGQTMDDYEFDNDEGLDICYTRSLAEVKF